jgi:DNA mismatch endonuclease (patch repair protein)
LPDCTSEVLPDRWIAYLGFVDPLSPSRRSENMRRIRSKDMRPELIVRRLVHGMGYRYRLHSAGLPGKPDLAFPKLKKIIEVRGCFWHQHRGCIDSHIPKSRTEYWAPKLERNKQRDTSNLRKLRRLGWDVLVIWECAANEPSHLAEELRSFLSC